MENKRDRHFTEEEIKDKIMQSAEGMEVPDSLKPENIEKKLAQKKKKRTPVYGIVAVSGMLLYCSRSSGIFRTWNDAGQGSTKG
ncbi:MAG: hypothetical protein ACLRMN_01380 [Mediterraneibacter gnavus]